MTYIQLVTIPTRDYIGGKVIQLPVEWLLNITPRTEITKANDEIHGLAVSFLEPGSTASFWYFCTMVTTLTK